MEAPADPRLAGLSQSGPVLQQAELERPERHRQGLQAAADWPAGAELAPLPVAPKEQPPRDRLAQGPGISRGSGLRLTQALLGRALAPAAWMVPAPWAAPQQLEAVAVLPGVLTWGPQRPPLAGEPAPPTRHLPGGRRIRHCTRCTAPARRLPALWPDPRGIW